MISVVIPAYNAARWLPESLRSVQRQTLQPAEVIVVDDGSTDETAEVAHAFGVRVISKANGGVAVARNVGIRSAASEWVALLDHDDLWRRNKLEKQTAVLERFPDARTVFTDHSVFGLSSYPSYIALLGDDYARAGRQDGGYFPSADFTGRAWMVFSVSSFLCRRDIFDLIGFFDEDLNGTADVEFCLRAMRLPFCVAEESLTLYRQTEGSLGRRQVEMCRDFLKVIQKISEKPAIYPPGILESALRARPTHMRRTARALIKAGHPLEAMSFFARSYFKGAKSQPVFQR
jgi:glycosyltransferase involved in cell wall biosynthesis